MNGNRVSWRALTIFIAAVPLLSAPARAGAADAAQGGSAAKASSAAASGTCEQLTDALLKAPPADRVALAGDVIQRPCRPVPPPLWNAIRFGKWSDATYLTPPDRVSLLVLMVGHAYPEAESLAVELLEGGGRWPEEGSPFSMSQAIQVITGLKPALTPYRIRLLLDIYDQLSNSSVRVTILKTLHGSKSDEAMLPMVSACWDDSDAVKRVGLAMVSREKEKTPDGVLARLIRNLPPGQVLDAVEKLGLAHPGPEVTAALTKRGAK